MNLRNLFQGTGEITFDNKFLSLRVVRQALESKFKIVVQEESSKYLKCKIIRYARIFGAPVPFPNPTLEVIFRNEDQKAIIQYYFKSHDYALLAVCAPVLALMASENTKELISILIIILTLSGLSILVDTKYFSSRIRKELLKS